MRYQQRDPLTLEQRIQAGHSAYEKLTPEEKLNIERLQTKICKKINGCGTSGAFELLVALAIFLAKNQPAT